MRNIMMLQRAPLAAAIAATLASPLLSAQQSAGEGIEEVVVTARLRTAAEDVILERMEQPVVADFLDAAAIARVGDSTVALALRRVPGLTLVNDQFVYVRGLGERYSSTLLNGAPVPSPDLTRNVVPLDIFPTAVLQSLAVQKAFSPEMPAGFGGGTIDIRTRPVPDAPVFSVQLGTGYNSDSTGDEGLYYSGGDDDRFGTDDGTRELPGAITTAIQEFQGQLDPVSLARGLRRDGSQATLADGEALNRQLATAFNRNIDIKDKELDPDLSGEIVAGSNWAIDDMWEIGGVAVGSYEREWRNRDRVTRSVADPDNLFFETTRTEDTVDAVATGNVGVRYGDDHSVQGLAMYIRSTEDQAAITNGHTQNFALADGRGQRFLSTRYEERELTVYQASGSHELGEQTIDLLDRYLPRNWIEPLAGVKATWYYSDSNAQTDIPNETNVAYQDFFDVPSGTLTSSRVINSESAGDFAFSDSDDNVEASGARFSLPLAFPAWDIELSGGYDWSRKDREFYNYQFGMGSTSVDAALLEGTPSEVFSDAHLLDPANNYRLIVSGLGTESYLAAQTMDAGYGALDATWQDTWRFFAGLRWEDFDQVSLPIDQLEFTPCPAYPAPGQTCGQVAIPQDQIEQSVFLEDDYYPAVALTWMTQDFWAEDFQLRLSWSETVVRPDLREISNASYIDPLTEARISGNPALVPSELSNVDLRGEWFFASGDNFTVSLFYKDISDPIETVSAATSGENLFLTFVNAESAEVYGIEVEWLKELGFAADWAGEWVRPFFLSGNFTVSDSEITVGDDALSLTNDQRPLTGHSDFVANIQLGFDSDDGMHSASLVYNVFSERVYFAGRNGADDTYEQPFNSIDLVYSFYPTDNITLKLAAKNILDEEQEFEQSGLNGDVTVLEQTVGQNLLLDLSWKF